MLDSASLKSRPRRQIQFFLAFNLVIAVLAVFALPSRAMANTAVPGVLMVAGSGATEKAGLWIVLAMATCILTEGVILQIRCPLIGRPYLLSVGLNLASAVLGAPIAIAAAMLFNDMFIIATAASIWIECALLVRLKWTGNAVLEDKDYRRRAVSSLVLGNLVSNSLLVVLLMVMSQTHPAGSAAQKTFEDVAKQIGSAVPPSDAKDANRGGRLPKRPE